MCLAFDLLVKTALECIVLCLLLIDWIVALQAIGVELDLTDKGLGVRSRRYSMLVDDGTVSPFS